jgi:hypothetical protein
MTTGAAAEAVGVAHATLLLWLQNGDVRPAYQTGGGHYRWYLDDLRQQVDAMLRRRRPDQQPEPQAEPEPAPAAAKRTPVPPAVRLPQDKRTRLKASDPHESAQVEPRPGLGPKRIGEQSR